MAEEEISSRTFEDEERYVRGSLDTTKRLLSRLPGQEERFKNVENLEIKFFHETTTMLSEETKAMDEEVIKDGSKQQTKVRTLALDHLVKTDAMATDATKVAKEAQDIAEQIRSKAKDRYEQWNVIFWILFVVGLVVALLGAAYGVEVLEAGV